jgi:hypothetical protein
MLTSPYPWVFTHHLSSWLTTWVLDSPLESLTHHSSSWLTTWVLDSPLESLTHHLSHWLTTWVLDSPLHKQIKNKKKANKNLILIRLCVIPIVGSFSIFSSPTKKRYYICFQENLVIVLNLYPILIFLQSY